MILNEVGELVCDGSVLRDGTVSREVLERPPVVFRSVAEGHHGDWVGTALRYYERPSVPLLQLFWPDREGRFPWEESFETPEDPRFRQPLLFRAPEGSDPGPGSVG